MTSDLRSSMPLKIWFRLRVTQSSSQQWVERGRGAAAFGIRTESAGDGR